MNASGVHGAALSRLRQRSLAPRQKALHSPISAITSAIIFNALITVALIPLALRGVRCTPSSASDLPGRNLRVSGLGGLVLSFLGIKVIDLLVQFVPGL
ncbi:hypothetical protein GCM10010193_27650 [Kitasatospora atroaurantiaca]